MLRKYWFALVSAAILAGASGAAAAIIGAGLRQDAGAKGFKLDAAERRRVLDAAIADVGQHYFDKAVGRKIADALRAREKAGDDDAAVDGEAFAALLTKQMRDASADMHMELIYSGDAIPARRGEPAPGELARFRKSLLDRNCLIEKVEVLPNNIGYLKLNWFADAAVCRDRARAAMAALNNAAAIIFDLRENRGGDPAMVALIGSYLFDHPEYWFSPREAPTESSWTRSQVEGNKLADKPVYVLTSPTTYSGAEQFCYDLKMLKRATLVGETTGGGAHAGVFHRIDEHFGIAISEARVVNPYAKYDWEGTGVGPDVKVKAEDALETAERLAEDRLPRK
jgi:peptidase S41-like protein